MATATELTIDTTASDLEMAQTIFGDGIQVISATFTGDPNASGVYTGADTTIPGVTNSDSGVILSTGKASDFTNSSGTTDTNVGEGTGIDNAGIDGDIDMNSVSGQATFDGAVLEAEFIPTGDYLTMQFVFTSEEYPEYVQLNVNDSFGVWVNGQFVEATITTTGNIAIDIVNQSSNQNLYQDNTADQFNTEMDGITYTLSFKAPVNPGQVNTIKIGIADGGDALFDSNVLIAADSIQTVALALDDTVQLTVNSTRTVDVLANDRDLNETGLTVTHVMGQPISVGQTVTIGTGEHVTLNADGTLTVTSDGEIGSNLITYSIIDGVGNTDVGYLTIITVPSPAVDGVVQGTAAGDLIDISFLGDPDGDRVDSSDATGIYGTTGEDDYILAGAGDDTVLAGAGNDSVFAEDGNDSVEGGDGDDEIMAGTGDDTVFGGAGNDAVHLEAGNDVFGTFGPDSAGNDSVYGGSGNDFIIGGAADDRIEGGTGDDTLSGGIGNDSIFGGDGQDGVNITEDHQYDSIDGGEGGTDFDTIWFGNFVSASGVSISLSNDEAGNYSYFSTDGTGDFSNIEAFGLTDNNDSLDAAGAGSSTWVYAGGGDDIVIGSSAADYIVGGSGNDVITGNTGSDSLMGGDGNDTIDAGPTDPIFAEFITLSGPSQAVTGTNGNSDFDHSLTTDGPSVDAATVILEGGLPLEGYHVGNGADANETHTHSFTQTVASVSLTLADIDLTETVVIWLDGVAINLNDAIASGLVSFDPGTTGFFIDASGAIAASTAPVTEPFPAVLIINQPLSTIGVQNVSATGAGNGTVYSIDVNTNPASVAALDDDSVEAGSGDDVVTTGAGNDLVDAGTGNDMVDGGIGDDVLDGAEGNDVLSGGEGADTLLGGFGDDTLDGGEDADLVDGGAGNDSLLGGGGDDTLSGGAGLDTLAGGDGNDSLTDLDGATDAFGGEGDDTIATGAADDTLSGDGGNDSILAGDGADSVDGGLGSDTVLGGAGNDTLYGGVDQQVATSAPPSYTALSGTAGSITGTAGNPDFTYDVVSNTGSVLESSESALDALGEATTLTGYQVGDGTPANESHTHSFGSEVASVSLRIVGLNTVETLVIFVNGQPIDLNSAIGLGLVSFNSGTTSYFVDGDGNLASSSDATGPFEPATLTINGPLTTLTVQNVSANGLGNGTLYELSVDSNPAYETLSDSADSLLGEAGDDVIAGGSGDDTLSGGTGNDNLAGDAGNDLMQGDAGNDTLTGGDGEDSLFGGDDRDTFYGSAFDVVDGGEGGADFDTLVVNDVQSVAYGGGNNEAGSVTFNDGTSLTFTNIENLIVDGVASVPPDGIVHGTAGDDAMEIGYVDAQGDIIDGADGSNDTILAADGNDFVSAGAGNDNVYGGAGNDTLAGGAGDNLLFGGAGDDVFVAGAGADTFAGDAGQDNLDLSIAATGVNIDLATGIMSGDLIGNDSLGAGIDGVIGSDFDDTLSGFDDFDLTYTNQLYGGGGNDLIDGRGGDDSLVGGTGNDTLIGGLGNDQILGGDDADRILGGSGDTVAGGEGGNDNDVLQLDFATVGSIVYGGGDNESGTVTFTDGGTLSFTEIEMLAATGKTPDGIIWGTAGADLIGAGYIDANGDITDNNDAILSNPGSDDDEIFALDGNDVIQSLLGDDRAYGGTGDDLVQAGVGNDYAQGDEGNDTVQGEAGDDFLRGDAGNDRVYGGDGNDSVYGGADTDQVFGGAGNDQIFGGFGTDTVYGGDGDDTVTGSGQSDEVHGDAGNDFLQGSDGNDTLYGGLGSDTMLGEEDADSFYAGAGDYVDGYESVTTGTDNDTLYVTGVQSIAFDTNNDENGTITFTDGGTLQFFNIERLFVDGTQVGGPDYIVEGTSGDDIIDGAYVGDPEGDLVDAADNLAGNNDDVVETYGGNDWVWSGDGNDLIDGGAGNDTLQGDGGNDTIFGGEGNDHIFSANGQDIVYGGAGDDIAYASLNGDLVFGGEGNDSLTGGGFASDGHDTLYGETGNDTLSGNLGNDRLYGGDDADLLQVVADLDNDTIVGGEGGLDVDVLDLSGVTAAGVDVTFTANEAGTATDGSGVTVFSEIEQLVLTSLNDSVDGTLTTVGLAIEAGTGDDTVLAGAGADTLAMGAGNDLIDAGAGNDRIGGAEGNDTVQAGAGDDTVYGEDGDDRIVLADSFGNDVIEGGEAGEVAGDALDLSGLTIGVKLDLTSSNAETGSVESGTDTAVFTEIERIILGGGSDTLILADGSGDDTVEGFAAPIDNGDGSFSGIDQLDVSGLTDAGGDLVNTADVIVSGDINGNAILTFPNGESITLVGVAPADVTNPLALEALGIPLAPRVPDSMVEGTTDADYIDGTYLGDPDGDLVDAGDNATGTNDDLIEAYGGADTITAGDGNDIIYAGTGDDSALGGDGNDSLLGEDGADVLIGDGGDDTLDGGNNNDSIYGGSGNDTVIDGEGDDYVEGGDGDDWLDGPGNDTYYGGSGNDTINAGTGNDLVYGGTENDILNGEGNNDSVYGDAGNDTLNGGDGVDIVYGGTGNDNLIGGGGNDSVYGGAGDDSMGVGDTGDDLVYGGTGNDVLSGDAGNDTLYGDEGDDAIEGHDGADSVYGGDGNDYLSGFDVTGITTPVNRTLNPVGIDDGSNDLLAGGTGNDTLLGGLGADTLYGDAGNDILLGGDGSDDLSGGDNDDRLEGGLDDDLLIGDAGSDSLFGETGNDTLYAGTGNDSVSGGEGDDWLYGEDGADSLEAGTGNDIVFGGSGNDTVQGMNGADSVAGGDGDDSLFGWADDDTLSGDVGNDLVDGDDGDDSLTGGAGSDTLVGDGGNDQLDGGTENDQLYGGTGNDTLIGGDGADVMYGADDRDSFFGGIGDTVDGGEAGDDDDTLTLSGWTNATTNVNYDSGNPENGTIDFLDAGGAVIGTMTFSNIENVVVPCFTPGTLIVTDKGQIRVENLVEGNRVLTRDNGYQTVRWIGRKNLAAGDLDANPHLLPVRIAKGALGTNAPERNLVISPQHRMLICGSHAELLFGEHEVLVTATHLAGLAGVTTVQPAAGISYIHLLLDRHEIIRANGAWTESYQPGDMTLAGMDDATRREVLELFPELTLGFLFPAARLTLKKHEAKLLFRR